MRSEAGVAPRQAAIVVSLGEVGVGQGEDILVTYALGSCVGVALWDPASCVAGLGHVFLPRGEPDLPPDRRSLYADHAVPLLVSRMEEAGARRSRLLAKIAGGANVLPVGGTNTLAVGPRNVAAVREALAAARIPLRAEAVGGRQGRTMWLYAATGRVVLTLGSQILCTL